jgi:plastocyanin
VKARIFHGWIARLLVPAVCVGAAVGYPRLVGHVQAAPAGSAVTVEGFAFRPRTLEIKAGEKVTWTNNDDVTHTVTSGTPDQRTGDFNQALQGKGAKFEVTFAKVGTFAYFCSRHNSMRGEIVVKP